MLPPALVPPPLGLLPGASTKPDRNTALNQLFNYGCLATDKDSVALLNMLQQQFGEAPGC